MGRGGEGALSNHGWSDFAFLNKSVATGWILFGIMIVFCCAMKIQSVRVDMPVDPYACGAVIRATLNVHREVKYLEQCNNICFIS